MFVCSPDPDPACTNYVEPTTSTTTSTTIVDIGVADTVERTEEPVTTTTTAHAHPAVPTEVPQLAYTGSMELVLTLLAVALIIIGTALVKAAER